MQMQFFDSIQEMLDFKKKCPLCSKLLVKHFATGKYEQIINFGHKNLVDSFKAKKSHLILNRSFKIEDTDIHAQYDIDTKNQTFSLKITPSENELIDLFPIACKCHKAAGR